MASQDADLPGALWRGDGAQEVPRLHEIRAVATDMDGTFLGPDHAAPAAALEAARRLEAAGVPLLFATGRNRASAQGRLEAAVDLAARPGVFLNGAVVYGGRGAVIHERTVSADVVADVLRHTEESAAAGKCSVVLCRGDDHFVPDLASPWAMHLHREYDDPSPKSLGGWAAAVSSYSSVGGGAPEQKRAKVEEPHLLHVVASREELDVMRVPLEALCGARVKSARSLPTCLTLLHPSCSKADGLIPALKELGVEARDTLALGDAENDIEMLQEVGIGVAVGNAMPKVKAGVVWRCAANSADPPGVARVLRAVVAARAAHAESAPKSAGVAASA